MIRRHVHVRRPASAAELSPMRRTLCNRLAAAGVPFEDIDVIALSVSEAATNAIEHAYGPPGGDGPDGAWFEVDADVEPEAVEIVVRDAGHWRPKRSEDGGRGLALIGRLMDDFELRRRVDGTEVWMRRTVRGKD
jgi:anti-sigma regulatory factor (Ser/Thr protein kinase)